MTRVVIYHQANTDPTAAKLWAWKRVAVVLWDADAGCVRTLPGESGVPDETLDNLTQRLTDGDPFGWIADDYGYATQDECLPAHPAGDRQRLGIRADAKLTTQLVRERQRAACRTAEESAARLLEMLTPKPTGDMRENADLDAAFFA
jgi:hypothetical protein